MPRTHYVCYNQVSYTVACENALQTDPHLAVLLVAPDRIYAQARYAHMVHRPLSRLQLARACLAAWLDRQSTLYTPHHRTPRLVRWLARLSGRVCLVDDGLDTLREQPRNVDCRQLGGIDELITFTDYAQLARWTAGLDVRRVCRLADLGQDDRPAMDVRGVETLVVESPGVDLSRTASPSEGLLVVTHSNPDKRAAVPAGCRSARADGCSLERTVAAFDGALVVGESMVLVFALHRPPRGRLHVQLKRASYENLVALHGLLARADVQLELR
jgi:hypothetical protein